MPSEQELSPEQREQLTHERDKAAAKQLKQEARARRRRDKEQAQAEWKEVQAQQQQARAERESRPSKPETDWGAWLLAPGTTTGLGFGMSANAPTWQFVLFYAVMGVMALVGLIAWALYDPPPTPASHESYDSPASSESHESPVYEAPVTAPRIVKGKEQLGFDYNVEIDSSGKKEIISARPLAERKSIYWQGWEAFKAAEDEEFRLGLWQAFERENDVDKANLIYDRIEAIDKTYLRRVWAKYSLGSSEWLVIDLEGYRKGWPKPETRR